MSILFGILYGGFDFNLQCTVHVCKGFLIYKTIVSTSGGVFFFPRWELNSQSSCMTIHTMSMLKVKMIFWLKWFASQFLILSLFSNPNYSCPWITRDKRQKNFILTWISFWPTTRTCTCALYVKDNFWCKILNAMYKTFLNCFSLNDQATCTAPSLQEK